MPPFQPVKSKAQARKMFVLAEQGRIPEEDAIGKVRAAKGKKLPNRVPKRSSR